MGGHVIGSLRGVRKHAITIGCQAGEEPFQIAANAGVRILAQDQARTGMVQKDHAKTVANAGSADGTLHLVGDIDKPPASGQEGEFFTKGHK